jgi:4-hydroxy-4-methyl-2-oxoglutarate aldolase
MSATEQPASLTTRLAGAYSGAVFDVLRARGVTDTVLPREIVPLDDTKTLAGPVFTMRGRAAPGSDAHQTLLGWTEFLGRVPAGYVAVCEGNDAWRALMGELSAETLLGRGVLGYISDGGCRDCAFIRRIGFPVFSRYHTPRDVVGTWLPEAYDVPIRLGDVTIHPGDYIIGDIDGIVAIPAAIAESVVDEVERVMSTESLVRKAILSGVPPQEAYLRYGKF